MVTYFTSYPIPTLDAQFLFQVNINGDSIMQLKDGKLLLFYFRNRYLIHIYNEKTLQKLFEIDFYEAISEYEKEKINNNNKIKDPKEDIINEHNYFKTKYNNNKNSIKELSNRLILIARNNYLIELKIKRKEYNIKVVKELDNIILDINELSDKRIITITNEKIIILIKENEEYIIKEEYLINKNWKMECYSLEDESYSNFQQYYTSNILPNNRLLLNSFSFEEQEIKSGCVIGPPIVHLNSKIILIDLNNFEEIKSTKTFNSHANLTIMENVIIIQSTNFIKIYNINSFELIQDKLCKDSYGYIYKYNNKYVISFSDDFYGNKSLIFSQIKGDRLIQCHKIIIESLKKLNYWNYDESIRYGKYILISKNKRIIILNYNKIIVFQFYKDL